MHSRVALFLMVMSIPSGVALASENPHYAGEQTRDIKALSRSHTAGLLAGKGMGYGRAAELNGYPGPAHVLELAGELALTSDQQTETQVIFVQMEASAKELGAELVAAERALDQAFKDKVIDEASLLKLVQAIGDVESRLRAVHLKAHLQQARLMDAGQISKYMDLRGYQHGGHGKHHRPHDDKS